MADKIDFDDINIVKALLEEAQNADEDLRSNSREAHHFIDKKDGQWEPTIIQTLNNRPRYTFDKTGPIVDQIAGEMENADFTLRTRPAGGEASKDTAKVLDGLIRNIRNISNAEQIFNNAGRSMITGGIDGWEVVQDWVDADAFEQDLFIRPIPDFVDTVWFDTASTMQDRSDARFCFKLKAMPIREYETEFPDEPIVSVGDARRSQAYTFKPTQVLVGQIYYKKPVKLEIVQMTNGAVYKDDDNFQKIKDELALAGITIERDDEGKEKRRTRDSWRVHSRLFNGQDWLTDEEETVFDFLPVIPTYGNYKITEHKFLFRGVVEKLMDPQRVYNYAASRSIEEGALSPRTKFFMTEEQAEGHAAALRTMNTNADPVQFYNHVPETPPPFQTGGAQINPGLQGTMQQSSQDLNAAAGLFASNMGDNPGIQSGIAIDRQISKGDNGTVKWFKAQEVAICYTAKVLINAIPRVYDSRRQIRIIQEDGSTDMVTLNDNVFDQRTKTNVEVLDLSIGQYDVVCEMGPAFKSQQRESAAAFAEIAAIDPSIIGIAQDLWLRQTGLPGMELVADRSRALMLREGLIPRDQFTDEEEALAKQEEQAAQEQPPQPDPNMLIAQAEILKGQAEQQQAQNKQVEIQGNQQNKAAEIANDRQVIQLDIMKFERSQQDKFNTDVAKINQGQQKLDQDQQKALVTAKQNQDKIDLDTQAQRFSQVMQTQQHQIDALTSAINQMKGVREASGAEAIIGPGIVDNFKTQSDIVTDEQKDAGAPSDDN